MTAPDVAALQKRLIATRTMPSLAAYDALAADAIAALDAALARERRLREALTYIADTYDGYVEAHAGRGHKGEPHDEDMRRFGDYPPGDPDACSACAGAQYGTEVTMGEYALPQARAALAETTEAE